MKGGGAKSFHSLKGGEGRAKSFTVSLKGGGGAKRFGPAIFPFCATRGEIPPIIHIFDMLSIYSKALWQVLFRSS